MKLQDERFVVNAGSQLMWIKKLLLPVIVFALTQGFRGASLVEETADRSNLSQSRATVSSENPSVANAATETSAQGISGEGMSAQEASAQEASGQEASEPLGSASTANSPPHPLHSPRLSNLLLPLPPLLLPELLLPPYDFPSFNSQRLDQELQLYLRFLRAYGKPDVLIVGSSRSLQGIDPSAMQEALAEQGYPDMKVFNFGINGATAQVINLLLQEVLTPDQLPQLIIWGDGSRAFNSGNLDITFNGIVASAGYRRLEQGDRPIPSRTTDWEIPTLTATSKASLAIKANPEPPIAPDLDSNGFEAISTRFDPETYYQQFPWVAGRYDADYLDFNLEGEQTEAMIDAAEFARTEGITLLFVNLPLTRDYLDPTRLTYERQFQQHMWRLAAQEKFMFRDLSQQPELMQNGYFADPSHINRHGARAVSFHLVQDQTIPWQLLRRAAPAIETSETSHDQSTHSLDTP